VSIRGKVTWQKVDVLLIAIISLADFALSMSKESRGRAATSAKASAASGVSPPSEPNAFLARRGILLAGGIIVLAALAAYHNSFVGSFMADDYDGIVANPTIRHWASALSPPSDTTTGGRPLFNLTFALNYALGGMNPWGYHAFNLLVHALAALTLFGIVRRTLLRQGYGGPALREHSTFNVQHSTSLECGRGALTPRATQMRGEGTPPTLLALAVAVIWVVHPLLTQTVTYISERAESLMGLFYLLTLYGFIRGVECRSGFTPDMSGMNPDLHGSQLSPSRRSFSEGGSSRLWATASVATCILGVLTKETIVTAPVMVLLYDRTFVAGSFREAWRLRWRYYLGLAISWLLLAHQMIGLKQRGAGFNEGVSWWHYALTSCRSVVLYLKLAVWPHPLVFDYGSKAIIVQHATEIVPQALILAALLAGTAIALWRWPAAGFAGAWFFIILSPTSSVVPVAFQPIAEYRVYLSLVAVVAVVVLGLYGLMGRRSLILFAAMAVGLGWLSVRRNEDYRSELAILSDTVAKQPDNARAHNNLGLVLTHLPGREADAVAECEVAVKLEPDSAGYHTELGSALANIPGRQDEAIAEYQAALRIKPDSAEAHNNLAMSLEAMGNTSAALAEYRAALKINPASAWTHNNLGILLASIPGRLPDAILEYQAALKIDPAMFVTRFNLANSLAQQGRYADASGQFDEVLKLKPDDTDGHIGLGVMLAKMGQWDAAIAQFDIALQLEPGNPSAQKDLALAQSMRQKNRDSDASAKPAR
jgi:tetratricopeptide (TPR) repeat protein